jgi:threonyl-tRNA synthetase
MPVITLPDGSQKRFEQAVSVAQVAASIGAGLAKAALAGRVDGVLVDTSAVIDHDASLSSSPTAIPMRSRSSATRPRT